MAQMASVAPGAKTRRRLSDWRVSSANIEGTGASTWSLSLATGPYHAPAALGRSQRPSRRSPACVICAPSRCGAGERAADALHRLWIDAKPGSDLAPQVSPQALVAG